jgi:hypothetical protein
MIGVDGEFGRKWSEVGRVVARGGHDLRDRIDLIDEAKGRGMKAWRCLSSLLEAGGYSSLEKT